MNGNFQFTEDIYIHPKDLELCQAHSSAPMRQFVLMGVEKMGALPESFDKENYLAEHENHYVPVEEGHVFDLGGKKLEVIELPGHTVGSIGLFDREEKVLLVADAIAAATLLNGPEAAPLSVYRQTIQKAKDLDPKVILQGHGDGNGVEKEMLDVYYEVTENVEWEKAIPYKDGEKENPDVRVVCRRGQTLDNREDKDFVCIVFTRDKLDA